MVDHLERIGQLIGDYRLVRWLGGGGFGHVYLAKHIHEGSQVALKLLQIRLTNNDDFRAFLNEARTIRLKHPHIVPLLDFGLSRDGKPFLLMEYAARGTLRDRHPKGSRVPLLGVIEYATQVASALQYAHDQHLVHRDVKPENMLVRFDGVILLSDFGIATTADSSHSLDEHPGIGGTLPYMSPEQLEGKPCKESDQYALAVVIYEWLAGRCPFQGTAVEVAMQHATKPPPSLVAQVPGLPREVETVLFQALEKDPQKRFPSLQIFLMELQQASYPPTLRKLSPLRSDTVLHEKLSPPALTPTTPVPPAEDVPTVAAASEDQLAATQPVKPVSTVQTRLTPGSPSLTHHTTPPVRVRALSPPSSRRLSTKWTFLFLVLLVLLVAGGSSAYAVLRTSAITAHNNATATAMARSIATATARTRADATATVATALDAYQANVARFGSMFGFDAQHTHANPYERLLSPATVAHLQQLWVATTGDAIFSSPVVANSLVYVGSDDGKLYAIDTHTGQPKWTASTGGSIESSPAVVNGLVYIGSTDYHLYAFNATTGKLKWVVPTSAPIDSSPTVVNGLVYVGSVDTSLYAIDAATGKVKWATPIGGSVESSPAVANGLVYVGSEDGKVHALNATTGREKWASFAGSLFSSSPAIANGLVYISSNDSELYAFDALSGQRKWITPTSTGAGVSSPAIADSLAYIGSNDTRLYGFDATTGQQKWVASVGGPVESSPTVANGVVYVGSDDAKLYAFDATGGKLEWFMPTGAPITSSPAVVNGVVYVGSHDHKLYAFSLPQTML